MVGDRYPINPGDPYAMLEQRFRNLEQLVNELARSNPLNHGTFHGTLYNVDSAGNKLGEWSPTGFALYDLAGRVVLRLDADGLSMFDADGDLRARIGLVDGTHYGLLALDADGVTPRLWVDDRGLQDPYLSAPCVDADTDYKVVTSGTFVTTHRAQFEQITSQGLYCWVTATAPAGTTGEIRLRDVATTATTDAVAVPAGGQVVQQFRWLHGSTLSAGPVTFEVQARRTSGAGDVNVYKPPGMWMTSPGLCVTDGVP